MTENVIKTEADDSCPPGMTFDKDQGKCMEGNGSSKSEQEGNAGTTADKGTKTLEEPAPPEVPATDHECPDGTSWQSDKGICEPSGNDAGKVGGAGTGAPDVPGKELMQLVNKSNAAHSSFTQKLLEKFQETSKLQIESILGRMGLPVFTKESAAFGNVKKESISSQVDTSGFSSVYTESVEGPAKFFEASKNGTYSDVDSGFSRWSINPTAYLESLQKGYINYAHPDNVHAPVADDSKMKGEGFTITGGDMPQIFSKLVYLIPGGRMKVPIRQFLDTQIIETADRFNWYTVNGFDFDDTTAEGTAPTTEAQTITKIQAVPTLTRALQIVNYSDIENAPFDLIEAFNRAVALGAIDAEAKEVLDTTYQATVTAGVDVNGVGGFSWVNGNTGALITADDVAGMTMTQESLYAAKREIDRKGGDSSPGNLVFFAHPKAIEELVLDTANDFFTGSPPVGAPLHSTALGILENRLGVDIVMSNRVAAQSNSTNDTYRNILAMKGVIGLAVAADLQIEAQRRPDLSAIFVGARHRIKGAVIDPTMTVQISTAQ